MTEHPDKNTDDKVQLSNIDGISTSLLEAPGSSLADAVAFTTAGELSPEAIDLSDADGLPQQGWRLIQIDHIPGVRETYAAPTANPETGQWHLIQITDVAGACRVHVSPVVHSPVPGSSARRQGLSLTWATAPSTIESGMFIGPKPALQLTNTSTSTWDNPAEDTATALAWIAAEPSNDDEEFLVAYGYGPVLGDLAPGESHLITNIRLVVDTQKLDSTTTGLLVAHLRGLGLETPPISVTISN